MSIRSRVFEVLAVAVVGLMLLYAAETRPGYFSNVNYLGGLILLEVVLFSVWHYEKILFVVLMFSFLWAGTGLPLTGVGSGARWIFLFVGAVAGLIRWLERHHGQHIRSIHLVALLCILSAAASSQVSPRPQSSLLKTGSLLLLFLYGSFGARLAVAGRELIFFRGLVRACEIISYVSAVLYLVLGYEFFGSPNSLGAVMGVVVIPVLLWDVLTSQYGYRRNRRLVALCLAAYLLCGSISRASILACLVTATAVCITLRRNKLLLQGGIVLLVFAAFLAVVRPEQFGSLVSTFTEDVVYKGKPNTGLFGSRNGPWQETVDVIKQSPWFGSGFGTDLTPVQPAVPDSILRSGAATQEHGNSYLALLQYVGILGVVPFAMLLFSVLRLVYRTFWWMWRSRTPLHYSVPLALICLAGLINAFFEDWLFAAGYYLAVFFWSSVFILADLQPLPVSESPAGRTDLDSIGMNMYPGIVSGSGRT